MRTRCPECHHEYPVSVAELRDTRGMLCCCHCAAMFDALEFLQDSETSADPKVFADPSLPWAYTPPRPPRDAWSIALSLNLLLLAAQWIGFTVSSWPQQIFLRPWLERVCAIAHCHVPVYRNLQHIELLQTLLQPLTAQHYRLHVALANTAPYPQPWPRLYLTLHDFAGKPYAAREFAADAYRVNDDTPLLPAHETVEITLDLVLPKEVAAGYSVHVVGF